MNTAQMRPGRLLLLRSSNTSTSSGGISLLLLRRSLRLRDGDCVDRRLCMCIAVAAVAGKGAEA